MDNYAIHTTELLDQGRPPKGTDGTPTLTVPISMVEPGLQKLVTSTQFIVRNQQKLIVAIQKSVEDSVYG